MATRPRGPESPSINAALCGVTSRDLVHSARALASYSNRFDYGLLPLKAFLRTHAMPWSDEANEELTAIGQGLRELQENFDDSLVEFNIELQAYCLLIADWD